MSIKIEEQRKKKGITQDALAEMLHIDRSTIAKWETGAAMPRADKLPKIAEVFECTIEELFENG